ncbi:MAG TPA: hypothetical protein VFU32_11970, partial [Ktedonobacterales bacterium]|nr:hypothetical protein [Ktedonobacterales bacterium]
EVAKQAFDSETIPVLTGEKGSIKDINAGIRRTVRFEKQVDAQITVMRLPPGEDPDEVIRENVETWRRAVAEALPLIDFFFEVHTSGLRLDTAQEKAAAAKRLLPVLLEIRDRVERRDYVSRLATKLQTDERALDWELQRLQHQQARTIQNNTVEPGKKSYMNERGGEQAETEQDDQARSQDTFRPATKADPALALEEYCLGLLLAHPTLASEICVIIDAADFSRIETQVLYQTFVTALQSGVPLNTQRIRSALPEPVQELAERLRQRVEAGPPQESAALKRAATQAAYRLKKARLTGFMTELQYLSLEAERAGDQEELRLLRQRMQDVSLQQRTINSAVSLHG